MSDISSKQINLVTLTAKDEDEQKSNLRNRGCCTMIQITTQTGRMLKDDRMKINIFAVNILPHKKALLLAKKALDCWFGLLLIAFVAE